MHVAGSQKDVIISGQLTRKVIWGPPNFGENPKTDAKVGVWILKLDFPISVLTGTDIGMPQKRIVAKEVQIRRRLATAQGYDEYLGRHVVVTGRLESQVEYDDVTPVVINVTVVRTGNSVRCSGI